MQNHKLKKGRANLCSALKFEWVELELDLEFGQSKMWFFSFLPTLNLTYILNLIEAIAGAPFAKWLMTDDLFRSKSHYDSIAQRFNDHDAGKRDRGKRREENAMKSNKYRNGFGSEKR